MRVIKEISKLFREFRHEAIEQEKWLSPNDPELSKTDDKYAQKVVDLIVKSQRNMNPRLIERR